MFSRLLYRRFRGAYYLHHQGDDGGSKYLSNALMLEAASTSETLVNFYQTTRRNNPEDSHLYTRCRDNLKSH
jgi:hypothetical protein